MKGPGYKLTHDARRTWRCSVCGAERKLVGDVTTSLCRCRPEGTFMTIVAERTVAPRPLQVPNEHDVRSSEFGIEDMPVLTPHPSSLPPERTGPRRPRPGSAERAVVPEAEMPVDAIEAQASEVENVAQEPAAPQAIPESAISDVKPDTALTAQETPPAETEESGDEWGAGIL